MFVLTFSLRAPLIIAQRLAKNLDLLIADNITSPSELYWHRQNKKKTPYPVRLCDPSELILAPSLQDKKWNRERQVLVQYLGEYKDVNERALVFRSQLTPFNGTSEQQEWCPHLVEEYVKHHTKKRGKDKLSPVKLRVEVLYLDRVLERAVEIKLLLFVRQRKKKSPRR